MRMGIEIGEAGTWKTVGTVDVLPADIGKRLLFEDDKIYYIDDDGIKRRGFMYKKAYYFEYQGQHSKPKYHICKCQIINNWGKDAYRFANAEPIRVYSRNENKEVLVNHLELCSFCRSMLNFQEVKKMTYSTDFVEILKEAGEVKEPHEEEVDIFGYVKEWERISLDFRRRNRFVCARCGVQVEEGLDRQYMHTHHKDGNKLNNKESNLECLCIRCHAKVDETHRMNFSKGAKKIMLEEFIKKYSLKL